MKSREAIEKGIKIVPYDEVNQFFYEKTGYNLNYHLNRNRVVVGANPVSNLLFRPMDDPSIPKHPTVSSREQKMDIEKPRPNLGSTNSSNMIPNHADNRLWT